MIGMGLMLPKSAFGQSPPPPGRNGQMTILKKRPTSVDRAQAAANNRALGLYPGAAAQNLVNIPGVPHYFGPYANYANSPMPKGPVVSLTVDAPGAGYSATPTVSIKDVYGTGTGATAAVTVVKGQIASLTLTAPGSNYTAPIVIIEDATGTDAAASAFIGTGLTGGIRKFVDSLAGIDAAAPNTLGQFISVAVPDKTTYPGSDYYEIELGEFTQQFHTDLPATTRLRGYRQVNMTTLPGGGANPANTFRYLGPTIVAVRDVPVRVKFINSLPTGLGGELSVPVDESVMGAGNGPLDVIGQPGVREKYTQNRATLHLHGGLTPWISDGTPHQWITPAGETTQYPKGVSLVNVPDMWYHPVTHAIVAAGTPGATNDPGPGAMTFYYTNAQSARLMFYHDHAYGITRLNVYVGEAAGYVLVDDVELDLINGTNTSGVNPGLLKVLPNPTGNPLYVAGIPLIIQDKTFVDATTIQWQDPTWSWDLDVNGNPQTGSLWVPSVYMPAQNPYDVTGANAFGRWQYGPWFWPPTTDILFGPVPNEYYDPVNAPWEPPMRSASPRPSMGMEAFNDTMMINGTVYPYMEVEATTYRFRILNAANDRFVNLHMYVADPTVNTDDGRTNTEVKMVPALATPGFPPTWSTDGRAGGVPDPATMGPDWIQIGTEGGFLPEPVVIPPQPLNWNMNATAFNVGNVTDHSLLIGCAERADVLVDFSNFAGRTLILYNDAPAAFPALDPRYDYYTGNPDQTASGGTPPTQPGFGPNTRTLMQIRVKGPTGGAALSGVNVTNSGADYLSAPEVVFTGGGGTGAAANATCSLDHITVVNAGAGYTSAPTVQVTGGGGAGATATAILARGRVTAIQVTNPGSGYTTAPVISLVGGGATTTATAVSALKVTAITLVSGGTGYTSLPQVDLDGGGGYGAMAVAAFAPTTPYDLAALQTVWMPDPLNPAKRGIFERSQDPIIIPQSVYNATYNKVFPADPPTEYVQLQDWTKPIFGVGGAINRLTILNGGAGYTNPVTVTISGGGGTGATATAVQTAGVITAVTITNPGSGYTFPPTITVTGGAGTGAVIVANQYGIEPKAIHDEMGAAYDVEYGRMGGLLGLELPKVNALNQNLVLWGYASPPVDLVSNSYTPIGTLTDGTQIWKITHNGVDTHPIHFHLANVQLINRVAWDGALLPPEPNEIGWKETVRVNPLEHTIVAMRPIAPPLPFKVPNSIRPVDVTQPLGVTLMGGPNGFLDPLAFAAPVVNHMINFGWEYVWHCHILSHEEMDMMHAISFAMAPDTPTGLSGTRQSGPTRNVLNWTNQAANATAFRVERATNSTFTANLTVFTTAGVVTTYSDTTINTNTTYYYRVQAINVVGDTVVYPAPAVGYPKVTSTSGYSNVVVVSPPLTVPAAPTSLQATRMSATQVRLVWQDNATNETGFTVQRAQVTGGVIGAYTTITTAVPPRTGTGSVTYFDNKVVAGRTYIYRVFARNAAGNSAPATSNQVTV